MTRSGPAPERNSNTDTFETMVREETRRREDTREPAGDAPQDDRSTKNDNRADKSETRKAAPEDDQADRDAAQTREQQTQDSPKSDADPDEDLGGITPEAALARTPEGAQAAAENGAQAQNAQPRTAQVQDALEDVEASPKTPSSNTASAPELKTQQAGIQDQNQSQNKGSEIKAAKTEDAPKLATSDVDVGKQNAEANDRTAKASDNAQAEATRALQSQARPDQDTSSDPKAVEPKLEGESAKAIQRPDNTPQAAAKTDTAPKGRSQIKTETTEEAQTSSNTESNGIDSQKSPQADKNSANLQTSSQETASAQAQDLTAQANRTNEAQAGADTTAPEAAMNGNASAQNEEASDEGQAPLQTAPKSEQPADTQPQQPRPEAPVNTAQADQAQATAASTSAPSQPQATPQKSKAGSPAPSKGEAPEGPSQAANTDSPEPEIDIERAPAQRERLLDTFEARVDKQAQKNTTAKSEPAFKGATLQDAAPQPADTVLPTASAPGGDLAPDLNGASRQDTPLEAVLQKNQPGPGAQAQAPLRLNPDGVPQTSETSLNTGTTSEASTSSDRASADRAQSHTQAGRFAPAAAHSMAAHIAKKFSEGNRVFDIRLDPPELGRVEVKLELKADNRVTAVLSAERPEALAELQRSARDLEKALQEAGLDVENGDLTFELNTPQDQTSDGSEGQERPTETAPRQTIFFNHEGFDDDSSARMTTSHYGFALNARNPVDIQA